MKIVTILIPAYNEEEVLPTLFERLDTFAKSIKDYKFEFLFVNDGSRDKTMDGYRLLLTKVVSLFLTSTLLRQKQHN